MEEKLKDFLQEGEQLLWSGRPEAFETLDKTHKNSYIKSSIITVAVTLGLIVAYILSLRTSGAEMKVGLLVIMALLAVYLLASTFLHAKQLRKSLEYAVTNKRLVLYNDEPKGISYDLIPIAALRTDEDGHSSLLCGAHSVNEPMRKWRSSALAGIRTNMDSGVCEDLVMYAVPDPERLRQVLAPYLTLN